MDTVTSLRYTIGGIVIAIIFVLGLVALSMKSRLYGKVSIIPPLIAYTIATLTFGAGLIYIINKQFLSDDLGTQVIGIRNFIGVASALVLIGGGLTLHILGAQGIINVQAYNYFASFLILQFCLMTSIAVTINKVWTL